MKVSSLTGTSTYFEDFVVGQRFRHARGATISEVENNYLSKQVMNTAQAHWNEHFLVGSVLGDGRVVFGLITASVVVGLTSQDTSENAVAELGLNNLVFGRPVHQGDTISAYTEVLGTNSSEEREDAGVVHFKHWGVNQANAVVCELERTVLVKRRSHWSDR